MVSFLMLFVLLCWCSEQEIEIAQQEDKAAEQTVTVTASEKDKIELGTTGHSVLCMIFLGKDEKKNADVITTVTKLRRSLQHKIHTIVFPFQIQQEKAAQDIIKEHSINKFPAVVVDGKLLAEGESLEQVCKQAARRKPINISLHLAIGIVDKETFVAMFYLCSFKQGGFIENGRVMVYVVDDNKLQTDVYPPNVFKALIADSKDYNVGSGSCHVPETVHWQIPEGLDPKNLRALMVVYDGKGKILGTCCSDEDCTEKEE